MPILIKLDIKFYVFINFIFLDIFCILNFNIVLSVIAYE